MYSLVTSWSSHEICLIIGNSYSVNWIFVFVKCCNEGSKWSKIGNTGTFDVLCLFSVLIKHLESYGLFCSESIELIQNTCLRTSSSKLDFWVYSEQATNFTLLSCLYVFEVVSFRNLWDDFQRFKNLPHFKRDCWKGIFLSVIEPEICLSGHWLLQTEISLAIFRKLLDNFRLVIAKQIWWCIITTANLKSGCNFRNSILFDHPVNKVGC